MAYCSSFLNNEPWQGSVVCLGANIEEDTGFSKKEGFLFRLTDAFGRQLDSAVERDTDRSLWACALKQVAMILLYV